MIDIRWAALSDVGRARERNEDSWYGGDTIFGVADGLGGHRAGEVASRIAVEELAKLDRSKPPDPAAALVSAIRKANRAVKERAANDPETSGMGTTVTAVVFDGGAAHLAHVGDSRCYLLRGDSMTLVSRDHTLVARMVDEGALTLEQAEQHPQRSVLTRALGADPEVEVDTVRIPLAPGDRLILCSDGLSSVVPEAEIAALAASVRDADEACRAMVDAANERGGPDNITVLVLDVPEDAVLPAVAEEAVPAARAPAEPAAGPKPPARRRPVGLRVAAWALAAIAVLAGAYGGLRIWADRSWYVGLEGNRVAIYRGLPTDFVVSLHRLHQTTTLLVSDVAPFYVERLEEGVRAKSLEEAMEIAENVPRAEPFTVSPSPSPIDTPSPSPTVSPG